MKTKIYLLGLLCSAFLSCQKEYLKEKTDKSLLVPTTLTDFQAILDNLNIFNISPVLPVISSDDFYATDARINAYTSIYQKNSYIWAKDIDEGNSIQDWNTPYQQVFYANIVLDGLKNIVPVASNRTEWNKIKGVALFHRGFAFYNLVQLFAKPYDKNTASQELGIPIRLESDVNIKSVRGNLQEAYVQIIADLKEAESLLPITSTFQSQPNQTAAKSLLARVYLNMEDYDNALLYAGKSLAQNSTLLDYNTLSTSASSPFPSLPANKNTEVLFYAKLVSLTFAISTGTTVNDDLYRLYNINDLRKTIFFTSTPSFKGRYTGSSLVLFGGLANDEIYLIKAECEARLGNVSEAMEDVNTLLKKRWKNTVAYIPLTAADSEDALRTILIERRKELAFRGLRWGDLRRMNKDGRFGLIFTRTLNGETYTLLPNSDRYTFPIPKQEVIRSGLTQNER